MNLSLDWPTIVSRTLLHEGGYSHDPRDAGGETNFGISKRSYPNVDIKNLTRDGAIAIYARDYWPGISQLNPPLAYQVFDFAVNAGKYRAIQFLQFVAGTHQDGVLGPATMAGLSALTYPAQVFGFIARVQQFYLENPQWQTYGKGWIDRWTENLQYAAQDFR
jgi:lysozyme family protein